MMKEQIGKESPTFEEIAIIEKATGGLIKTYEWWTVKGVDRSFDSIQKPSNETDIIYHGVLNNVFCSKNGEFIGDLEKANWYIENRLKVYEPAPHGVAEAFTEDGEIEGYVGYTHRGSCFFKIGDKVFDENYEPKEEDYTPEQWKGWVDKYNEELEKSLVDGDDWWYDDIIRDGVGRFIPFKMRGSKTIENWGDAIQAAKNMSKYLS